jgi:hypothetical protein
MADLDPTLLPWIDALARQLATEYLTGKRPPGNDSSDERTKPVPLPDLNKAA